MRLCVAGTGMIVQETLPLLQEAGFSVAALCGTVRSQETAAALCRQYGIPTAYTDYAAMLPEAEAVYIAVPNHLHFAFARQALEAGCHVIVEKPMASNARQAEVLAAMARERGLCLFEAISTLSLPGYQTIRRLLPQIGEMRLAICQFGKRSRRYDAFLAGELPPVFDAAKSGGALMDLNLYNVHFLQGLFGAPVSAVYHPNIQRGIDTSGVLTLSYDTFQAVSIAAKDCSVPCGCILQGTDGYLRQDGPANKGGPVLLHRNDGSEECFPQAAGHRMAPVFRFIRETLDNNDTALCYERLAQSVSVMETMTAARLAAGLRFPSDDE